jgi:tRNA pseudouridine38-40 synthase
MTENIKNIALVLEYDGTNFSGWQIQPELRTVQGALSEILEKILHHPVKIIAAGRTDAGVHASCQVVNFKTDSDFDISLLKKALNATLPRDISVIKSVGMPLNFSSRFDALSRKYRYVISTRKLSIGRQYAWNVKYRISIKDLEKATEPLIGECSLKGFSKKNDDDIYSTIIFKNCWKCDENLIIFEIEAIRFFQHAVRNIVGSAVEEARGKKPPGLIKQILETGDNTVSGPLAPSSGLCLIEVDYGEIYNERLR